jgi:hypothetical protein
MREKIVLPAKDALLDAMAIAKTSMEGANYLKDRFSDIISKAKLGDVTDELKQQIEVFAKQVWMQLAPNPGVWDGKERAATTFTNLHANIADEAFAKLVESSPEEAQQLEHVLNFAIDEDGNFVRGWEGGQNG